jgi:hypothetical protein
MFFFDLNAPKGHTSAILQKEMTYAFRENDFCPTHGLSTGLRIPSVCPTIPRSLQDEKFFMLGSVSLQGLRTAHVPRKFERYRGLPSLGPTETLPHGYPGQSFTQYSGPCQPGERLVNLCRVCPDSDWPRSASLCKRFLWCGVESNGLCLGLHPHRFVSVPFSLGQVPEAQRSRKITHPLGSARKYSFPSHHYPWEDSRCDHPRSTDLRTGSPLHRGSGISRSRSSLWDPSSLGIFCDQSEKQFQVPTSLFSPRRQIQWRSMRSNHCARGFLRSKGLPRKIATDSLFRYHPKQTPGFLNQQLYAPRIDHRPTLSVPEADRIILQMDQAASSNQSLLWHDRERRQNPDLDCHHRLCAGGNRQKASEFGTKPLHNSTGFKRHSFRKNPDFRGSGKRSTL